MDESSNDIAARKRAVRAEVRARLAALDGPQIETKSRTLAELLFETPWWNAGEWVLVYIPMGGEVDTRFILPMISTSKGQRSTHTPHSVQSDPLAVMAAYLSRDCIW